MTIVVFCPNLIGDTVMATPTLRACASGFRSARILGVIKPHVSPTLDGAPWLDDRILFDPRSRDPDHGTRAVLKRLRDERPELAVLLPNSFRSALMAWRSGARRRVGYARGGRGFLLTDRLEPARDGSGRFLPTPIVESYLAIARRLGCRVDSVRPELFTTEADEAAADRAWSELGLDGDAPVVCLNTGGRSVRPRTGRWSTSRAWRIASPTRRGSPCSSSAGRANATRPARSRPGPPTPESSAWPISPSSIGLTKACIRRSALLITTDSGPRHFAAAFRVPVLTLFGPTHIAWTRTYHPQAHPPLPPGRVRALPATDLSARASSLHARADSPGGLRRRAPALAPLPSSPRRSSLPIVHA